MAKTLEQLGKIKKREYPGEFDDLTDLELGRELQKANPGQYDDYVDKVKRETDPKKAVPRSMVSKAWEGLNRAFNVASDPLTKKVLGPAARALPINEEAKIKIKALEGQEDIAYPSDVLEQVLPALKEERDADIYGKPPESNLALLGIPALKTVARMGTDIALDPLSYVTFGAKTKLGKIKSGTHAQKIAGKKIKLDSQTARDIAKLMGDRKVSPNVIGKFLKKYGEPGATTAQQIEQGERSLVSFAGKGWSGKNAAMPVKALSAVRQNAVASKLENGIREVFSTKSGNHDFDTLISKYRSVVHAKAGLQVENAKVIDTMMDDIAKDRGIPRDVLNREITRLVEGAVPSSKKVSKQKYGKALHEALEFHYVDKIVDAQLALKKAQKLGNAVEIENHSKSIVGYQGELNKLRGSYQKPPSIDPETDKMVNEIRQRNHSQLLEEQMSGVRSTPLVADIGYIPHIMTNEAREAYKNELKRLGKLPPKLESKEMNEFLANNMRREFAEIKPVVVDAWQNVGIITKKEAKAIKGKNGFSKLDELLEQERITSEQMTDVVHHLPIEEVNALSASGKLRGFGTYSGDIFHTDPIFTSTVRGIRGERARTATEFFGEMRARKLALPDKAAPSNWVNVRQSELAGHKVAPEVARVLNKMNKFDTDPTELSKFWGQWDKITNIMKLHTLVLFPKYHVLNSVGNVWNNWLAGVNNPDVYRQASFVQMGRKVEFKDALGEIWDSKKLAQEAKKLGVVRTGWYGADIQRTLKQKMEKGKLLTLSSRSHILRLGQKIGGTIEDNARMAHFIDRIRKGDTAEEAALSVKKYLFDYGDLTDIERKVLNRMFFFYTWTRKNIPLQLQSLATTPYKFKLPYVAKHEIEKLSPEAEEKYLPEYVKENFPLRIRYNAKKKEHEYFMLGGWLPAADLVKIVHLHDIAAQMLHPLPKEFLQQAFNYDYFLKRQIEKFFGQTDLFHVGKKQVRLPKRVIHGMKIVRYMNEIDRLSKADADLLSTMISIATGRNYNFNVTEARMMNKRRVDKEIQALKSGIYSVSRQQPLDQAELARLQALILEKAKEY